MFSNLASVQPLSLDDLRGAWGRTPCLATVRGVLLEKGTGSGKRPRISIDNNARSSGYDSIEVVSKYRNQDYFHMKPIAHSEFSHCLSSGEIIYGLFTRQHADHVLDGGPELPGCTSPVPGRQPGEIQPESMPCTQCLFTLQTGFLHSLLSS